MFKGPRNSKNAVLVVSEAGKSSKMGYEKNAIAKNHQNPYKLRFILSLKIINFHSLFPIFTDFPASDATKTAFFEFLGPLNIDP